jgi:hypothetical protein
MGVHAGDGGLHLVGTGPPMAQRLVDQRQPLGDHVPVPQPAILLLQENNAAVRIEPGRRPRVLKQEQRRETHDLGLAREQPQQQASQPDGFLAQRHAHMDRAAAE